ncbi:hypothetical protein [Janthinobacterium sp. MDT1-19]|uniref:hypothetical protein n=1 Tax=Janthinobacterium sp. MDT1-19 TaxID=1259339 RepID=UPI003F2909F0
MPKLYVRKLLLIVAGVFLTPLATAQNHAQGSVAEHPSYITSEMYVNGNLVSKTTKKGATLYLYRSNHLVAVAYPNGQVASYQYNGNKLDSISFTDGTVHTAVYEADSLVGMESSTGKKLKLSGTFPSKNEEKDQRKKGGSVPPKNMLTNEGSPSDTTSTLNAKLIASEGWESGSTNACPLQEVPEPGSDDSIVVICGSGGGGGGGGDWGGDWGGDPTIGDTGPTDPGGGSSMEPPGAGPGDSPARASCMAAAYRSWLNMDTYCRGQGAGYFTCNETNWRLYDREISDCNKIP